MAYSDLYRKQLVLLIKMLPFVAQEKCFALKGGTAIIIYLISHEHSPHSLLSPVRRDITQDFSQNFMGMTDTDISLEMLLQVRERLIAEVVKKMPHHHKDFLRSFYRRQPNWILLGLQEAQHLPAVKWREMNLDKSGKGTSEALLSKLEEVIGRE